jgi:hypothetical protein
VGDNGRTRSAAMTAAKVRPATLVIFGGGDLAHDAVGILLGARMPLILTSRADNVRMTTHLVAALCACGDQLAAAGIDKVGG